MLNGKKTIIINGMKIKYYDNEMASLKTLLFIHGNSSDANSFACQMVAKQFSEFRLVVLDLPGHGDSDPSNLYSIPFFSKAISDFAETLKLKNTIVIGHSLGGHFAIQAIKEFKGCIGLFLFGTGPLKLPLNFDEAFLPNPIMPLLFKKDLNAEEIKQFANSLTNEENSLGLIASISNTHNIFREHLMLSVSNGDLKDEIDILNTIEIPIVLCLGDHDTLVNRDYLEGLDIKNLWRDNVQIVEGTSHYVQIEAPELFNHLLESYLKDL
jgi:pimeloyl-ACP methyl ester carboxylesterase